MKAITKLFFAAAITAASPCVTLAQNYNYGESLAKSLLFYQLQESGKLSQETLSRTNWRGDCCLKDGQDNNIDLTGGWNDAGDNAKFNLPMSFSSMVLAWSYLNNPTAYTGSGQEKWLLHDIKWANDYFVKCNPDADTYYFQVSNEQDHSWWVATEIIEEMMTRPSYKVDGTSGKGGSCVCGETAASLAAASIILKDKDPERSKTYLEHAKTLLALGEKAKSDEGYNPAVGSLYHSWSGFYDELSLASAWLYQATGDKTYLDKAKDYATHFGKEFQGGSETSYSWPICWDDVHLGACMKLAELTGDETYSKPIENMIDYWCGRNNVKGSNPINRTQGGLPVMSNWGSIRYAAGAAFMGEVYAKWDKAKADYKTAADGLAQQITNYVLGSSGQVFQVGYGTNYPTHEHHRTAHGSWNNNMADEPDQNRHVLQGAVVGGPSSGDDSSYKDVRNNYETNEVACDYNACYTGMVAAVFENTGVKKVADPSAIETPDGKEFFVESGINCQDSQNQTNFVELKIIVRNHTAWPARVSKNLHVRVYYDISDVLKAGKSASDFTLSTNYAQKPVKISKLEPTGKDGIYYADLDLTGDKIMPAGQDPSRCEIQFRVSGPQGVKWDYMKSPSLEGVGGSSQNEMKSNVNIELFDGTTKVWGTYTGAVTGISQTKSKPSNFRTVGYYDLTGRRVSSSHHGLTVVKMSDGTVKKVIL
ncbi:MAG: glycoside hydrolase family 9 protein [Prevotellaceae bacterium]|nr:glycoside hydrolase family 9 protein [Prevotellaceae bacterium]